MRTGRLLVGLAPLLTVFLEMPPRMAMSSPALNVELEKAGARLGVQGMRQWLPGDDRGPGRHIHYGLAAKRARGTRSSRPTILAGNARSTR